MFPKREDFREFGVFCQKTKKLARSPRVAMSAQRFSQKQKDDPMGVILPCEQDAVEANLSDYVMRVGKPEFWGYIKGDLRVLGPEDPKSRGFYLNFRFLMQTGMERSGPIFFMRDNGNITVEEINQIFPRPPESDSDDYDSCE